MCEVCLMAEMLSTLWQYIYCITGYTIQSLNDMRYVTANNDHAATVPCGFLHFALFYTILQEKINPVIHIRGFADCTRKLILAPKVKDGISTPR